MKSTELRIGNLVYNETIKGVMEVYPMMLPQIERCELAGEHNIKPIPLTEEWLLKLHPNALDLSNSIFRVGRFKLIWKFSYKYWYVVDDMTAAYMTKIEFVHEWQNFWHIMNGEELTINKY